MRDASAHRVLIVATRFPSPIQPWLVNQIAQIYRHGGSVVVVARRPEGDIYPSEVDELGLLERTHYFPMDAAGMVHGLARPLGPGEGGRSARAGLRRLVASDWRPEGTRAWIKAVVRAPAIELADVDLVHAHSLRFAHDYMHLATIRRVPLILTFHGHTTAGVGLLSAPKRERLFERLDAALVNTEFARRQLADIGCPEERIHILPQGIRLADYPFHPQPHPGDGPVRLLTVCRLQHDKGLTYSIDAADLLLSRGYDIGYTIVGGGPEEEALRARVAELGLEDRITLTGRVDDGTLRDLYRDSHVFLLPSLANRAGVHTETQGVVVQEAQASGTIVAASRVGGIPECVDDGESAFLFPDRDSEAIADTVAGIIDRPDRWREWQDAARSRVAERFDIDVLGDRLVERYATTRAEYDAGVGRRPSGLPNGQER